MTDPPGVFVTGHAIDQFIARYRDDIPGGYDAAKTMRSVRQKVVAKIFAEVQQALIDGRCASEPRWLTSGDRKKRKAAKNRRHGTLRYVWTPDRSRAYTVSYSSTANGTGRKWVVMTTLWVRPEARLAAGSENAA